MCEAYTCKSRIHLTRDAGSIPASVLAITEAACLLCKTFASSAKNSDKGRLLFTDVNSGWQQRGDASSHCRRLNWLVAMDVVECILDTGLM